MGRFNEGLVYTNGRCVGCNKCISVCPTIGANVSISSDGKTRLEVSKKCIDCGLCVGTCTQGARDFRDDFESLIEDLNAGEEVSLLVDPAFYFVYGAKCSKILGMFKSLGIKVIYDVAVGAEISMLFHAKYIKEHSDKRSQCRQFIANNCAAVINYIEFLNPKLIPFTIPVQSPSACTAIYAKKYMKDEAKLAYLSPCIPASDEMHEIGDDCDIDYNITFASLSKYIKKEGLGDNKASADVSTEGFGNIISFKGGFREGVEAFFERGEVFTQMSGLSGKNFNELLAYTQSPDASHPVMVSIEACADGCISGNGIKLRDAANADIMSNYKKVRHSSFALLNSCRDYEDYYRTVLREYSDLKFEDFTREIIDKYRQPYQVPDDSIAEIFESMHKNTKAKQHINCGSCGYTTCKDLAVAVANGYARIQDCVHYMNDDLKYAVMVDHMTGIPNGAGFRNKARQILDENPDKNYVLYVGNVNKLKNVNDLYGSEMGDKVLGYIAKRLLEMTDGVGVCGRMGGGVFSVLLEDDPKYIEPFEAFENVNCRQLGVYFPVTIRYGVYRITDKSVRLGDISNLCTYAADKARNRTKNSYIEYTESMRQEMQVETDITLKMRDAMANGEFVIYLQPQYDHHTGKIVGAEALSRWVKKDGSIISPGVFIPVFEKNGFIRDMDKYVWENAFKLVTEWEASDKPHVPISVNISRISLETDEIVASLGMLSEKYPIDKNNLYFEITESAYMNDQEKLTERILMIKNLGFKIAMDDFGSGYSSLNSLKDIPIDVLKLDMGFLRGGTNIERGNEIVAHMIDMAKALSLKTVAEGVETKEQADFLTDRGVDVIQGFYYARPMPLTDYEEKLITDM